MGVGYFQDRPAYPTRPFRGHARAVVGRAIAIRRRERLLRQRHAGIAAFQRAWYRRRIMQRAMRRGYLYR